MDTNLLEKTKQAVERYQSTPAGDKLKATKEILSTVLACKNFITKNEAQDEEAAKHLARELSELLSPLPLFRKFASDKEFLNNLDTKQSADQHLDMIERDLQNSVKEMQAGKKKKIQDWVKSHPVLSKLKKSAAKELPQGAYVLLFRRSASLPPKRKGGNKKVERLQARLKNEQGDASIAALTILEPEAGGAQSVPVSDEEKSLTAASNEQQCQGAEDADRQSAEASALVLEEKEGQDCSSEFSSENEEGLESDSELENSGAQDEADEDDLMDASLDELEIENLDDEENDSESEETAEESGSNSAEDGQEDPGLEDAGSGAGDEESPILSTGLPSLDADADAVPGADDPANRNNDAPGDSGAAGESAAVPAAESTAPADAREKTEKVPPDLVVRPAPDGKVFTRFRPKEFNDDTRVYRMFRGGPPLVGACIIADGKLITSIGVLPQPSDGRDQLRLLLSISKDAVGKPGRDFVEANPVLHELFRMSKSREIHKDAYVLLFQHAGAKPALAPAAPGKLARKAGKHHKNGSEKAENAESAVNADTESALLEDAAIKQQGEASSPELSSQPDTALEPGLSGAEEAAQGPSGAEELSSGTDSSAAAELESARAEESESAEETEGTEAAAGTQAADSSIDAVAEADLHSESDSETDKPLTLELVSRTTEDGRVITRYRSFDFNDMRGLYENFKKRPPVVGAAVIRERDLLKVLGTVPSKEGSRQLDVLLGVSRQALEKPAMDFINSNEILSGLFDLSNGDFRHRECDVVLFTETDGRPGILSMPDRRGKPQSKTPLSEFRIPKLLHDRFKAEQSIVGASVIGEPAAVAVPSRETSSKSGKDKDRDRDRDRDRGARPDRTRSGPSRSKVVLAAFGRTPLKQNVLLSPEILKRLGVDLSIL